MGQEAGRQIPQGQGGGDRGAALRVRPFPGRRQFFEGRPVDRSGVAVEDEAAQVRSEGAASVDRWPDARGRVHRQEHPV